jgi:glycosyltransferase involved in cell wall biosynthesis
VARFQTASPTAATPAPEPSASLSSLRVAIVHYWFIGRAGGEQVVEALADIFPHADLFALIAKPDAMAPTLQGRKITTSFLQRIPFVYRFHRHTLLLQPLALEQLDLSGYDLVLSSESGPAKGVITSPGTLHVCYCHSPMRYIWDMYPDYIRSMSPLMRPLFALTAHKMRAWDHATASRVDAFIANSHFVAARIRKYYRRDATVIHPPVQVREGWISDTQEDFYLAIGRLVPYKRFDLAVQACSQLGRKLKIIGSGPEYKHLRRIAGGSVEFLGSVSDTDKQEALARCRALLFPGEEDFGIVPVEAQAFGRPVIAYASGGVLDTVNGLVNATDCSTPATGVFFHEQSTVAVVNGIRRFELHSRHFDPVHIRRHALRFDSSVFRTKMTVFLEGQVRLMASPSGPPQ